MKSHKAQAISSLVVFCSKVWMNENTQVCQHERNKNWYDDFDKPRRQLIFPYSTTTLIPPSTGVMWYSVEQSVASSSPTAPQIPSLVHYFDLLGRARSTGDGEEMWGVRDEKKVVV